MRNGLAAIHTVIRTFNARLTPCWARRWAQLKPRSLAITPNPALPAWAN